MRSNQSLIVVTGATGWVGRNILEVLQKEIPHNEFNSNVVALASKEQILFSTGYKQKNKISIQVEDLKIFPELCKNTSNILLIHSAFLTKNYITSNNIFNYIYANKLITSIICEGLSLCKDCKVVEISSGAASAFDYSYSKFIDEEQIFKDPYGYLKKSEEVQISKIANTLILRIYSLSGKFVRNTSIYALSSFLSKAIKGKSFKIDSNRSIYRSYGHANNIAELACKWLLSNNKNLDSPINTVSHTTNLVSLAKIIEDEFNLPNVTHLVDFSKEADIYISSEEKFINLLSTYNIRVKSFKQQIIDTANYLKTLEELKNNF